jgi:PAS domain S-box-containing protein
MEGDSVGEDLSPIAMKASTESQDVASGDASVERDLLATDSNPAGCADNRNLLEASTELFEIGGAGFTASHCTVVSPDPAGELSSSDSRSPDGHARTLDQQVPSFSERLEKFHCFNDRYVIGDEIGSGGMGVVYRGWDLQLQRYVAIKLIRKQLNGNEVYLNRFLREARIASQLSHPSVLGIHDFGSGPMGSAYIIMDLIIGTTMERAIEDTRVNESKRESMLTTFFQICQAMAFAHASGVVHRDLKPANIMLGDYGTVTVLDWGLAKVVRTSSALSTEQLGDSLLPLILTDIDPSVEQPISSFDTQFGTVMGTPHYLAPEQARGESVDYRADVFSLGGILCHLLTGSPPFAGSKIIEVYQKSIAGDLSFAFAELDRCGAPMPIVHLAKQCLDPHVASRPKDASFLVETLRAYLESGQRRAEEELVRFFDLSLDLFCIANIQGYFWRLNENFTRTLGYSHRELTAKPFLEFVHPDDRPNSLNEIIRLSRGEPTIQFINRYRHRDGHYVSLEWTARSVSEEGVIYAVARDVTDRLRLEEEKRRLDADCLRLSEIVDSASDAIIGKDLDGIVQSWNFGAEKLFGYTSDEMVGQAMTRLVPADRIDEEAAILKMLRQGGRIDHFETIRLHKSGERIDVSVSISPIHDALGKIIGASKIARSIRKQRTLEAELRESRQALVDFAENANVPLHCVDKSGIIVWANKAELTFLGYPPEEYIGQPIAKFHVNQATIGSILAQLLQGNSLSHRRAQLIAKDGSTKDVAIYSSGYRENGELVHTRCFTIDVARISREDAGYLNLPTSAK